MNTRRLVTDAVLIALYVVLNFYTIRLGWLNISLAAFPILVAALLYGWADGLIVGAMSGLVCAVFIVLTANIVTGIMLGFAALVIGRIVSGDVKKLNIGTIIIAIVLVAFYAGGWAI